jgi:ERCC4-type nuclease
MSLTAAMIDNREPAHITSLKFGGVPVAVTMLDCGDAWASTDDGQMLIIERKTPSDLLGSIKDGRLFQQVAAMRERSKWSYLCVTGALAHTLDGHVITDNRTTGWKYDDVVGALITVQEMGVSLISCQSDQHYEEAIIRLSRRDRKAVKAVEPRTQARVLTQQEQVLTSLPGIGIERAGLLLGEHGSAAYSIAWLTWMDTFAEELSGIGNGTKATVRKALGLKAEEWLAVLDTERAAYAAKELLQEERASILGMHKKKRI